MKRKFWGNVVPEASTTNATRKAMHTSANVSNTIDLTLDPGQPATKSTTRQAKPATAKQPTLTKKKTEQPSALDAMRRAWIGVVSRDHVQCGVQGGFAQVCHGKEAPLKKMKVGDGFIYYSPSISYKDAAKNNSNDSANKLQSFTAIGSVKGDGVYSFKQSDDFIPYRRDISYKAPCKELALQDIKSELEFTQDKNVGLLFRRGLFEIPYGDYQKIAKRMGLNID